MATFTTENIDYDDNDADDDGVSAHKNTCNETC